MQQNLPQPLQVLQLLRQMARCIFEQSLDQQLLLIHQYQNTKPPAMDKLQKIHSPEHVENCAVVREKVNIVEQFPKSDSSHHTNTKKSQNLHSSEMVESNFLPVQFCTTIQMITCHLTCVQKMKKNTVDRKVVVNNFFDFDNLFDNNGEGQTFEAAVPPADNMEDGRYACYAYVD